MYKESEKKLSFGPVNLGGAIGRMVELPDGHERVETWGATGWERGGADVYSIMRSPYASPAILREYYVPEEFWDKKVLEEDRRNREEGRDG
jgi:hypothetical protein